MCTLCDIIVYPVENDKSVSQNRHRVDYYAGGPTLKSYRHDAKKWVGGLEVNFHKRSLCVKFSHNTCTAL